MTVIELARQIALRCSGLDDSARASAFVSDLKAAGMVDGPNVGEAFDAWRGAWPYRRAPMAGEFVEKFYRRPERHYTEVETTSPDPVKWADHVLANLPEGAAAESLGVARDVWLWCRDNPGRIPPRTFIDEQAQAMRRISGHVAEIEARAARTPYDMVILRVWRRRLASAAGDGAPKGQA